MVYEALSLNNLLYCAAGSIIGTITGVLPGVGPALLVTIIIPFILTIGDPVTSIIFLAAIFYGAQYGGSITAILLGIPGEPSSAVTVHASRNLVLEGRAHEALVVSAVASFIAGVITLILMISITPVLVKLTTVFTPIEYFWLYFLTILVSIFTIKNTNKISTVAFCCLAYILGTIGVDTFTFIPRNNFNIPFLENGINIILLIISIFGINEVVEIIKEKKTLAVKYQDIKKVSIWEVFLNKQIWKPSLRGTAIGAFLGVLPGAGSVLSSSLSYTIEKNKDNKNIGLIAAPEAANNASAQSSFVPLLVLGLPTTFYTVIIYGVIQMINANAPVSIFGDGGAQLLYTLTASMVVGNLFLLFLNYKFLSTWVKVLRIPADYLFFLIILSLSIGLYVIDNSGGTLIVVLFLVLIGILMLYYNASTIAFMTVFLLSSKLDAAVQKSIILYETPVVFLTSAISLVMIMSSIILIWWVNCKK